MELWIRSQDRMTLCKCNNIYIDDKWVSPYYIKDGTLTLGKYETRERALEVLDEIQKILKPQIITKYETELECHPEYTIQNVVKTIPKTEIKELSTYVYEMPKE